MNDRVYERVIDLARGLGGIAENYEGERRQWRLQGVLEDIVVKLDCHRPDDLAARAVVALAEGWLAVLDIEEQDKFLSDDDDDDAGVSHAAPA